MLTTFFSKVDQIQAKFYRLTMNEKESYSHAYQLITYNQSPGAPNTLRQFLLEGFDPNSYPTPNVDCRYRHLLYTVMNLYTSNPNKVEYTLLLLDHGAKLSYIINADGYPNLAWPFQDESYSLNYMKLLLTHGLYLPALEQFLNEDREDTDEDKSTTSDEDTHKNANINDVLKFAKKEPGYTQVQEAINKAELELESDTPNYHLAGEHFKLAAEHLKNIYQKESLANYDNEDDAKILAHYQQRAADCLEEASKCYRRSQQQDNKEDTETSTLLHESNISL